MALPQKRHDAYGNPIEPLVDAREESYYARAFNTQQRQLIYDKLEQAYRHVLRAGVRARLTVDLEIKDGTILREFSVNIQHRYEGPELSEAVRQEERNARFAARHARSWEHTA